MKIYFATIGFVVSTLGILLSGPISLAQQSVDRQPSDQLGSTMTLEQLSTKKMKTEKDPATTIIVSPAAESVPALRYRMWLPDFQLSPGEAQTHFYRALLMIKDVSPDLMLRLGKGMSAESTQVSIEQHIQDIEALKSVFFELRQLALAENNQWDLRIRDLRGIENVYGVLLPDAQEARTLAWLLEYKIRLQILQRDWDGAVESLRDGFRLAAFVSQGELLVPQLVAYAIEGIMYDSLEELIQAPNSPNMYWALATIPRPINNFSNSLQFELNAIDRALPIFAEVELENRTQEFWEIRWRETIDSFVAMNNSEHDRTTLVLAGLLSTREPRQRLLAQGFTETELASMPPLRITILDIAREIRRVTENLSKVELLPHHIGNQLIAQKTRELEEYIHHSPRNKAAAIFLAVLVPEVQIVRETQLCNEFSLNRLMTIEAIRMYASIHAGNVPAALGDLQSAPALPDPFTGESFGYEVLSDSDQPSIALTAQGPQYLTDIWTQITIRK